MDELTIIAEEITSEAVKEAGRAIEKYKRSFASQHEFYGVLMEEIDELWTEIKKKEENYDIDAQIKEATQCAAILIRFIHQLKTTK